ncbi:MAG TPA: hypothetical protein VF797_15805 [Noviherbaspirillum sp.]
MSRNQQRPVLTSTNASAVSEKEYSHPAYGRITLGKITAGGGVNLFGSDLKHTNLVSLKINLADEQRNLHESRARSRGVVCEVVMSEAQWAHLISSSGMGDGNPCTFRMRPDEGYRLMDVPGIEREESPQETYAREVQEKCTKYVEHAGKALAQVRELVAAGKANKGQLQALAGLLASVAEQMPSNMAFAQDQFAESMAKTVNDGKIELETFVTNLAMRTGIDMLRASAPRLIAADDPDFREVGQ